MVLSCVARTYQAGFCCQPGVVTVWTAASPPYGSWESAKKPASVAERSPAKALWNLSR